MWLYIKNVLIGIDQLANTIFRGEPDETLSSRAWRLEQERGRKWPRILIDLLFFFDKNHCYESYLSEIESKQLPSSMRE
jgi:hypothetical protein